MTRKLRVVFATAALATAACGAPGADSTLPESAIVPLSPFESFEDTPGGKTTYQAAVAFRATLSQFQAGDLVLPIDSPLRRNWSNLPPKRTRAMKVDTTTRCTAIRPTSKAARRSECANSLAPPDQT